jgi:hypothetical protein
MTADSGDPPDDGVKARGIDRAGAIIAELAEAFGAAASVLAEEQRVKAAADIAAVSQAARSAARSLDESDHPELARRLDRAGDRMDDLARIVRDSDWRNIAAETADLGRRRPALFALGAISFGFVAGRLLLAPADRDQATTEAGDGEPAQAGNRSPPNGQAQ